MFIVILIAYIIVNSLVMQMVFVSLVAIIMTYTVVGLGNYNAESNVYYC